MRKIKFLSVTALSLILFACGGEEKKEEKKGDDKGAKTEQQDEVADEPVAEVKLVELDLSEHGYNITISVPEGVAFEKGKFNDALKNTDGSFSISINRLDWTKDEALKEAQANDLNKFKTMLDETDNGYHIETEVMGKADFHMWMSVNDGGEEPIIFENEKGNMPTKANSTVMFNSLKSIAVK